MLVIGEWLLKTFPLMKAAEDGKENEARMLVEKGANVNANDAFGWTALHWAAVNRRLVVARLLLENGAQVGRENEDGWTALHFAVSQGHKAVTRLLLDRERIRRALTWKTCGIGRRTWNGFALGGAVLPLIQLLTYQ